MLSWAKLSEQHFTLNQTFHVKASLPVAKDAKAVPLAFAVAPLSLSEAAGPRLAAPPPLTN